MIIFYDSANLVACKYTDIELDFITTLKTPSIPTFVSPAIDPARESLIFRPPHRTCRGSRRSVASDKSVSVQADRKEQGNEGRDDCEGGKTRKRVTVLSPARFVSPWLMRAEVFRVKAQTEPDKARSVPALGPLLRLVSFPPSL